VAVELRRTAMKDTIAICDRCSVRITEAGSVLTVEAGELTRRLHQPIDLFRECAGKLLEWLSIAPTTREERGDHL
jgi:hypothetical protein